MRGSVGIAALITVHGLLSFLSDVYGLLDSSGKTLWLSVDHRRLRPIGDSVEGVCTAYNAYTLVGEKAA